MITIAMSTDKVKIRGHAGYAPHGQDIVYAGVTALTQTLVESIETLTGNKMIYDISPGRVDIEIKDPDEDAQLLMSFDDFLKQKGNQAEYRQKQLEKELDELKKEKPRVGLPGSVVHFPISGTYIRSRGSFSLLQNKAVPL